LPQQRCKNMLEVGDLYFQYPEGPSFVFPSFRLNRSETLLILGASGKGKSTYMNLISGWRKPSKGRVSISNTDIYSLSAGKLDRFRAENIGAVHQQMFFIPSLTARENLEMTFYLTGRKFPAQRMRRLAKDCGIEHLLEKSPSRLSQGEQQRLSIVRALLHQPVLILADEPTSSLDDDRANEVVQLLISQSRENQSALIVVTHDSRVEKQIERRILL
jgi:putative ABC transport system ATP-binding protein